MRLFVALDLPEETRAALASLMSGVPGARWVEAPFLHLTLRFIGETDETAAYDLDMLLAGIRAPSFTLAIEGFGQFRSGRQPRVLWAGIAPSPPLQHLAEKVESACVRAGFAPAERKFAPHITLARLRESPEARVMRFVADSALFRAGPIAVTRFTLYESERTSAGPLYHPLRHYPLERDAR